MLAPLLALATPPLDAAARIDRRARSLVRTARAAHRPGADVTDFLAEYGLGTAEGVALLCLAEALLRIPDAATADALIEDRIATADWQKHLGHGELLAVNASAWAFMLSGRVLTLDDAPGGVQAAIGRMVRRLGEPVIRTALRRGMHVLARQFVMGRTIEEALAREEKHLRYSFDMLGEAARTHGDAERYRRAYLDAIGAIGRKAGGRGPIDGPGMSVKLSALHPRYDPLQAPYCVPALIGTLTGLVLAAKEAGIGLTIDAEEADRLEISLDVFTAVLGDPRLSGWDGFGFAVQAYQKRALPLIDWIAALGRRTRHRVPVRLVKGAYWDSEIKVAQVQGHADYPVFTRKAATDVSWLACARRMLDCRDAVYPAFATHNAHSLAFVLENADSDFETQRLHGMGEALYHDATWPVRVYAPVGTHEDLLAYLVRRLLENGANTSFVHRLVDPSVTEEAIIADPVGKLAASPPQPSPAAREREFGVIASSPMERAVEFGVIAPSPAERGRVGEGVAAPNPHIPLPRNLYPDRINSAGLDLADRAAMPVLLAALHRAQTATGAREIRNPADRRQLVGGIDDSGASEIDAQLHTLSRSWRDWDAAGGVHRAEVLERAADKIEVSRDELLSLLVREGGKTLADGVSEIRETADYCRWYALRARADFDKPRDLPGPTGERNTWSLGGRGVFAAISPWNFPLAIFTGQVAAALAAGNAVAAKPAEQTPLVAARAVALLFEAGVPRHALALLPGDGTVGQRLVEDPRVAGVAFTGGTETARSIAQVLAARPGPIVPFIAETGGINAMIVDSSALAEQVVGDVLASAFGSAGQRCSALRLLCLQDDIADRVLHMLQGAVETLRVGDPMDPATDVGPVIDEDARASLEQACGKLGTPLFALPLPPGTEHGSFFAPRAYLLRQASELQSEIFGPVLCVVRYAADRLDDLMDAIDATGYGLTLGIHSRIESVQRRIAERLRIGNTYVNRNQIGAVVGVQPFGGRGLSGTGPKAGGPITLYRYAEERVVSINTAAAGGNAVLLASGSE